MLGLLADPLRWRLACELATSDRRVRELVATVAAPANLVSYHLRRLREGGLVSARRSIYDGRDLYYRLDLPRCAAALSAAGKDLHPGLAAGAPRVPTGGRHKRVLFVCTGNTARSPMAAALLNERADRWVNATSSGTRPKPVDPTAVTVMRDRYGLDLSGHRPTNVVDLAGRRFDQVISLCDKAREHLPGFPACPRLAHWSTPDPSDFAHDHRLYERLADDLDLRVRFLLPALAVTPEPREEPGPVKSRG